MIKLDRESVLKVADTMYVYIRESAKLNKCSFPGKPILMDAALDGLRNILAYQDNHTLDISKRDTIKIFAFAIPQLNKHIKTLRLKNFDMPDSIAYMACMDFINTTYAKYINLNYHPDMKNTCRILGELTDSGNELAGYTYLKGVQETCLCAKKKHLNKSY